MQSQSLSKLLSRRIEISKKHISLRVLQSSGLCLRKMQGKSEFWNQPVCHNIGHNHAYATDKSTPNSQLIPWPIPRPPPALPIPQTQTLLLQTNEAVYSCGLPTVPLALGALELATGPSMHGGSTVGLLPDLITLWLRVSLYMTQARRVWALGVWANPRVPRMSSPLAHGVWTNPPGATYVLTQPTHMKTHV